MTATPAPISGLLNFGDFIFNVGGGATRADEFDVSFTGFNQPVQISLNSPNLVAYTPLVEIINANTNAVLVSGGLSGNNSVIANFLPQFNTPYKIRVTSTGAINTTVDQAYTLVVNGIAGDIVLSPRLTTFNTAASSTSTISAPATQTGVLNGQDFTFPAPLNGNPSLADEYDFDFTAPNQPIQISLVSANTMIYDPFLQVINARTGVVIRDDDDSGGNRNSLITNFMPQGGSDYRIRVSSFNALTLPSAQPFAYTLQASAGAGQQVTLTPRGQNLPTLSINDVSIAEGNSGTTNLNFTVTLSAATTQPVTVNYATADQTATAGSDYTATNGSLIFNAGETHKMISVSITGDTATEPNETFAVTLSNPSSNATLGDAQGIGTINNDSDGGGGQLQAPVYRFFKPQTGGHFFTVNVAERDNVFAHPEWGYNYEGLGFDASANPATNLFPVYRFFKPQTGGHFFTIDSAERDNVIAHPDWGYNNEGIGFYAYGISASLGSDVFRFFKPQTGGHFFTINSAERDNVLAHPDWGYNYEGVGFEAAVA